MTNYELSTRGDLYYSLNSEEHKRRKCVLIRPFGLNLPLGKTQVLLSEKTRGFGRGLIYFFSRKNRKSSQKNDSSITEVEGETVISSARLSCL